MHLAVVERAAVDRQVEGRIAVADQLHVHERGRAQAGVQVVQHVGRRQGRAVDRHLVEAARPRVGVAAGALADLEVVVGVVDGAAVGEGVQLDAIDVEAQLAVRHGVRAGHVLPLVERDGGLDAHAGPAVDKEDDVVRVAVEEQAVSVGPGTAGTLTQHRVEGAAARVGADPGFD